MGADCSGVTTAIANNVAVPNGVTMISPSATSPALSTIADNGYFFRTAPSDARQGQILAEIVLERGISEVAVTFTNNDYGKGLSDSFISAYKGLGGKVSATVPHEDGKADYSAEVGTLDASGAGVLAVFGYVDQGGRHMIQTSIDSGAFDKFILADGMMVTFPEHSEQFQALIQKVQQVLLKWQKLLGSKLVALSLVSPMMQPHCSFLPCSPVVQLTVRPSHQMCWQSPILQAKKLCLVNWAKRCESWQAAVLSIMLEQQM